VTASATTRTAAQIEAARRNGAASRGPATAAGKARSALNGTRHGLCSAEFFLLSDEDPDAFAAFSREVLAALSPTDDLQHRLARQAVQAMWREARADRLEAVILKDLFAADALEDRSEAALRREKAMRSLGTLLRYRARIERERARALQALATLRGRTPAAPACMSEPKPAASSSLARAAREGEGGGLASPRTPQPAAPPSPLRASFGTSEPKAHALNRHERRRLAALERLTRRKAA
jgi:hypothetical protein